MRKATIKTTLVKPKDCEHTDIKWYKKRDEYNESLAFNGKCKKCKTKVIELWEHVGVYVLDKYGNLIGEKI